MPHAPINVGALIKRMVDLDRFEFTVEVEGQFFDVYWFVYRGKTGQFALTIQGEGSSAQLLVPLFRVGRKTAAEVASEIAGALQAEHN